MIWAAQASRRHTGIQCHIVPRMKLAEWARSVGVHPRTAYRWWQEGTLPVPAHQLGPRTIVVEDRAAGPERIALYAHVSDAAAEPDLAQQIAALERWASGSDRQAVRVETEIRSHVKLSALLADATITIIAVQRRAALGRGSIGLLRAAMRAHGRHLVCLDEMVRGG